MASNQRPRIKQAAKREAMKKKVAQTEDILIGPIGLATGLPCPAGFVVRYVPKKTIGGV